MFQKQPLQHEELAKLQYVYQKLERLQLALSHPSFEIDGGNAHLLSGALNVLRNVDDRIWPPKKPWLQEASQETAQ